MKGHVIVIGGPTASGKTALAIRIAQKLNTEIIGADSRQVYSDLNIGVARPTEVELQTVKHHFIAEKQITDVFNAGKFAEEGRKKLDEIISKKGIAIICGGTGLYINALLYGLDALPEINDETRNRVNQLYEEQGLSGIQKALLEKQPNAADLLALDNPARVKRALELVWNSGKNLESIWIKKDEPIAHFIHGFYLNPDRKKLYSDIEKRTKTMFDQGLVEEVKTLLNHRQHKALQTVGYAEVFDYLDGKCTLDEAMNKVAQHTRNYAKRQITWFRNKSGFQALAPDKAEPIIFETLKAHGYSIHE